MKYREVYGERVGETEIERERARHREREGAG